jgi:hypothetical protein
MEVGEEGFEILVSPVASPDEIGRRPRSSGRQKIPPQDVTQTRTLRQQEYTASDADIQILLDRKVPHPIKHQPVSIYQAVTQTKDAKPSLNRILDGFHILESSGATLPDDARQAVFVDKGLVGVVEEDLPHFANLLLLDVSENALQMYMMAGFPRLRALNLACNNINSIERSFGFFSSLQFLDLSYNSLTLRSVQNLDFLPNLKELDLCGNSLCGLPMEMFRFPKLEKIMLDNNKLDDNSVFGILCMISNLRYLSLAYNFLHNIPSQCCAEGYFPLLTTLDLSFNYFGTEEDVTPFVDLPRLNQVMLYGNPLLGPTGEDPLYTYIEDLELAATDGRKERRMMPVEIIAEIPRKRNFKKLKGRAAGRHATYRDFCIVNVEEAPNADSGTTRTNSEWREHGNKTLFADAIAQAQKEKLMATIPDNTFITASSNPDEDRKILKLADKVMDKVAQDLDLTTSAEILYFQSRTNLNTKNFDRLTDAEIKRGLAMNAQYSKGSYRDSRKSDEEDEQGGEDEWKYDNEEEENAAALGTPSWQRRQRGPDDKVPSGMFARTMADPSTLQTHPVAVKTAMRALQFAIRHPLTNYHEVPAKGGLPPKDYVRETSASINRKMPKQVPSMKPQSDMGKIKNKSQRGLGEPHVVAQARKKGHQETLVQIEAVLDKLNTNADDLALRGTGNVKTKDGIDTMKHFARPQTGLRGLVKMVDEVVADLDR